MGEEQVRDSLESLIEIFRTKASEAPDETLQAIANSRDFSEPSQLELFWMNVPFDYQILVLTHDENRSDCEIILNGPYPGREFVTRIDRILDKPRWNQPVKIERAASSGEATVRRDQMIGPVKRAISQIRSVPFRNRRYGLGSGESLFGGWVFQIDGNVADADLESFIQGSIDQAKARISQRNEQESTQHREESVDDEGDSDEDKLSGFGTYIFEPVWIGGPRDREFEEIIFDHPDITSDRVIITEFAGNRLLAFRDGYIFVETNSRERARKVLNTVFGTAIYFGEVWHPVRGHELMSTQMSESGHSRSWSGPVTMPRSLLSQPDSNIPLLPRRTVPKDRFSTLLNAAEGLFSEEELRDKSEFLLLALNHHQNGEYTQAFLLSWILIEQHFNQLLNRNLRDGHNVNRDRRNAMLEGHHWFISNKIELMEIIDVIDNDTYEIVDDSRRVRNKIVHDMDTASEQESEDVLELAIQLIKEDTESILKEHYDELSSEPRLSERNW